MEREIQENNGSPRGTGQRGARRKAQRTPAQAAILGGAPMGAPTGVPQSYSPGQAVGQVAQPPVMPPQPQGPQVNSAAILGTPPQQQQRQLGVYSKVGNMLGFNTSLDYGGNESAANSMKNQFGQIASRYKAAPSMTQAIMNDPDFKQFFPNATIVDHHNQDQIDFGGQIDPHSGRAIGRVDVGGAFDSSNDSGSGWTWQDLVNDVQGPAPGQAIYNQAQNQMGQVGGVQTQQMLEGLDENTLMELLRSLMGEQGPTSADEGQGYV